MKIPRSRRMIAGMLMALLATCLLPVVFLLALAQATDPRPLKVSLAELLTR